MQDNKQNSDKSVTTMDEILHPGITAANSHPDFPDAPQNWSPDDARQLAKSDNINLEDDHFEVIKSLQQFFARHKDGQINLRELHDALGERFHTKGGLEFVYELFPGGPVAQGCKFSGLKPPAGSADLSYGSVV